MTTKKLLVFIITLATVCGAATLHAAERTNISGAVYYNGQPLNVMVLANGEYMFTDPSDGRYDLDVPLDANGQITLFAFCDGLAPYKRILNSWEASYSDIYMSPASPDSRQMTLTATTTRTSSGWVKVTGTATYNGTPLNIMVLANGQYMFTNPSDGRYSLEVPSDENGNVTLFGFCDGMEPFKDEYSQDEETWYKDADGDGYSDGTVMHSVSRPSDIYYSESELIAKSGDKNDSDTGVHPESLELTYSVPSLKLTTTIGYNGNEQTVLSGNTPKSARIGEPVLPVIPATVVLPSGHEPDHVEVMVGEKVTLSGTHTVEHGQKPYPLLPNVTITATPQNTAVYNSDSPYPGRLYDTVGVQKLSGVSLLMVNLHPVEYRPVSGQLSYYKKLSLKVITNPGTRKRQAERVRVSPSRVISRLKVDNPETLGTYIEKPPSSVSPRTDGFCDPSDTYEYVLITSRDIRDASTAPNVRDLIDHRQARGLSAVIVTTEDIYDNYPGTDNAERLRNFIIDAYNNWETGFVLLGGDTDIIPMRKLYCESWDGWDAETDDIPSDLYYQCLDGNYNEDGDSRWGEPNDGENGGDVDLMAEVYVGRASAEDAEEMSNFVYKTMNYENSTSSYKNSALMVGEYLGLGGVSEYAKNSMEEIRLGSSEHGYSTAGFAEDSSYTTDTLYERDSSWDEYFIIAEINSDAYAVINHLGHANYNYVMDNSDTHLLTNSNFMFAYSQGYIPGNFEEDCIAEHLTTSTRNGMFAVVFNSRYGWGAGNSTDGASQRYDREFWDAFFSEGMETLGRMNADSHEDNAWRINESCMRWCYYESNLLGDPAVSLFSTVSSCTYGISPTSESFSESGGAGSVSVTSPAGCGWTAASHSSWISITSGSSGDGSGTVRYSLSSNSDTNSRTGTLTIAGKTFTVTQSGASSRQYTITAVAGGNGTTTPSGAVKVDEGESRTFTFEPDNGYSVENVTADGASVGAVSSYAFVNVNADHTIVATFKTIVKQPPTADAGSDRTVTEGELVTLNGSGTDPDGYIVSYSWKQTGGAIANLSNTASTTLTFTAPEVDAGGTSLTFQLTVTDNDDLRDTDTCVVYVEDTGSGGQTFTNSLGMTFNLIPAGTFMMGSPEDEPGRDSDETQHQVTLTQGFYMQITEVTQGQWKAVTGSYPPELYFTECGDNCPVERVSWNDVQDFISKMNQRGEGTYRLPTEAEWEYAARAGTNTPFYFGQCLSTDQGNYDGNYPLAGCPEGEYKSETIPVASLGANAWGLYDMHGNVWEWCQDWYGSYPAGSLTDPTGPTTGSYRVTRGGCWGNSAAPCQSAFRSYYSPGARNDDRGFRLVLSPGQQNK
ncbi:C25 family cysteine peptidase [Desulfococcaceae bacterium HSG8]|nr:C25 family cysteine peptidase [Desulfococcaceae bacterium HSG8]